jgi:hypothetical protein
MNVLEQEVFNLLLIKGNTFQMYFTEDGTVLKTQYLSFVIDAERMPTDRDLICLLVATTTLFNQEYFFKSYNNFSDFIRDYGGQVRIKI